MTEVTLTIEKAKVYEEVAQTTSYTGAKRQDDDTAYDRIFTTDEDQSMLERFWEECRTSAVDHLKRFVHGNDADGDAWSLTLHFPNQFDTRLEGTMERSLFSFMVMGICAKWFTFTDKDEVSEYADQATAHLDNLMRLTYHRKRPERP